MVENPNLRIYMAALEQAWEDGLITSDEHAIMEKLREALDITPEEHMEIESKIYLKLARRAFQKEEHEEAIEWYDKSLQKDADNEIAWMNKGFHLFGLDRLEEAVEAFDHVIELNPGNVNAMGLKGSALDSLGLYDEAVEIFNHALKLKPDDALLWSNLGYTTFKMGRFEEALRFFDKALDLDPELQNTQEQRDDCMKMLEKRKIIV